jgi:peptide maturation system acyl carrier-related protein
MTGLWGYRMRESVDVESVVNEAFSNVVKFDFSACPQLKNAKVLGREIGIQARELLVVLLEIESALQITIPDKDLHDGRFDSFQGIVDIAVALRSEAAN